MHAQKKEAQEEIMTMMYEQQEKKKKRKKTIEKKRKARYVTTFDGGYGVGRGKQEFTFFLKPQGKSTEIRLEH